MELSVTHPPHYQPHPQEPARKTAADILALTSSSSNNPSKQSNKPAATAATSKIKKEKQEPKQQKKPQPTAAVKKEAAAVSDSDSNEEEENKGQDRGTSTILEEVAQLWGMVKDRPFAESKFTQLALDRYVFCRELPSLTEEKMDAGVLRVVLLLREAAHIAPQMACHRILVTYKRKMAQTLRKDKDGYWLQDPVYKNSEAGRLVGVAAGLVLRLCDSADYGAYFLELVLDELLMQLYKSARDVYANTKQQKEEDLGEEDEEDEDKSDHEDGDKEGDKGGSTAQRRAKTDAEFEREREKEFAFRRQRDGFAAAALFTWLCKELGAVQRVRALVYDMCLLNGRLAPLGQLAAFFHLWPAILGPKDGWLARALLVCFHEAYKHQRDAVKATVGGGGGGGNGGAAEDTAAGEGEGPDKAASNSAAAVAVAGDTEAKAWVAERAYEGLARYVMGRKKKEKDADDEGVEAPDALANELKGLLLEDMKEGDKEEEAIRALVLVTSVQSLDWVENELLQEYATGELSTPPTMMRLLATVGREVTFRDAIERKSGDMLRRLLLCFSEVLAAEYPQQTAAQEQQHQRVRLWASKGLADLPGVNVGELKPVITWIQSLPAEARDALLPGHMLRTIVYNQQRPHCCAIIRQMGAQQADLELQGILHDVSLKVVSASVLGQMTHNTLKASSGRKGVVATDGGEDGGGDAKKASWMADGGWEHVAIWHLYANNRMDELDYPNRKPSEVVIVEGDVVGSPLLGAELRSLLLELRYRPYPWDVLALSFALPPADTKSWHKFKTGTHASALPKDAYVSRRGYILTHTAASKLGRVWQHYESVEECIMEEANAGRITLLAPGDGRPNIHMSAQDQARAMLRNSLRQQQYHGRKRGGGGGGGQGGPPVVGGMGGGGFPVMAAPAFPLLPQQQLQPQQDEDEAELERPPSPGFAPTM